MPGSQCGRWDYFPLEVNPPESLHDEGEPLWWCSFRYEIRRRSDRIEAFVLAFDISVVSPDAVNTTTIERIVISGADEDAEERVVGGTLGSLPITGWGYAVDYTSNDIRIVLARTESEERVVVAPALSPHDTVEWEREGPGEWRHHTFPSPPEAPLLRW